VIISHRHKFIFLKTNKTAGTSLEIALSRFCGPDDIITPISPRDEALRSDLGYRGPQNYLYLDGELRLESTRRTLVEEADYKYYNHISASEILATLDPKTWRTYFKFCLERNPWDRVVSLYHFRYQTDPRPEFTDFVRSGEIAILKKNGYELYTLNGELLLDRVCRYEALGEELDLIRTQLAIPEKINLPRAKAGFRPRKRAYNEYFDEESRRIVSDLFKEEIAMYGYSYEGAGT
jgi:hypothetical protein